MKSAVLERVKEQKNTDVSMSISQREAIMPSAESSPESTYDKKVCQVPFHSTVDQQERYTNSNSRCSTRRSPYPGIPQPKVVDDSRKTTKIKNSSYLCEDYKVFSIEMLEKAVNDPSSVQIACLQPTQSSTNPISHWKDDSFAINPVKTEQTATIEESCDSTPKNEESILLVDTARIKRELDDIQSDLPQWLKAIEESIRNDNDGAENKSQENDESQHLSTIREMDSLDSKIHEDSRVIRERVSTKHNYKGDGHYSPQQISVDHSPAKGLPKEFLHESDSERATEYMSKCSTGTYNVYKRIRQETDYTSFLDCDNNQFKRRNNRYFPTAEQKLGLEKLRLTCKLIKNRNLAAAIHKIHIFTANF